MGHEGRRFSRGEHEALFFDRNANAGHTVWVDGRIVGGWAQSPDRDVVFRLLGQANTKRAAAEARSLQRWLALM